MTSVRDHVADKGALNDAWEALTLIDVRVQRDYFGGIEGIDTLDLGLDAMARSLVRLFCREEDDDAPEELDDVLAFLATQGRIDEGAVDDARQVREGVKQSTYGGITDRDIEATEKAREALYDKLRALLDDVDHRLRSDEAGDG
jgi:hypothetical protein